jgi:BirA family biotin operon repressor/biotin-[acetyl-CoA-carboxylase] ligase
MQHFWPVIKLNEVDSTNNYANALLAAAPSLEEKVIYAQYQLKGRGQAGNSWEADAGKNLTFSLLLYPRHLKAYEQFYLLEAVSLAIIDFLKENKISACIKWPNDILADGQKIAGILIEHSVMGNSLYHSVIGIGLNVNQTNFKAMTYQATSMQMLLQNKFAIEELLEVLLEKLHLRINSVKNSEFDAVHEQYIKNLYLYKQWSKFKAANEIFEGKITNVLPTGELEITLTNNDKQLFLFKEIQFLSAFKSY